MKDGFRQAQSLGDMQRRIDEAAAVAVYFSGPDCGVCSVIRPQLSDLLLNQFPKIETWGVDCASQPQLAAAYSVFSVPTLLIFFEAREWMRRSRHLSMYKLQQEIQRPYGLVFS